MTTACFGIEEASSWVATKRVGATTHQKGIFVMRSFLLACLSGLTLAAVAPAQAAIITWGNATSVSGTTDVLTNGTAFAAATFYQTDLTINGLTFKGLQPFPFPPPSSYTFTFNTPQTGPGTITVDFNNGVNVYNWPVASPTDYDRLLSKTPFGFFSPPVGNINLGGLVIGGEYQVQIWSGNWDNTFPYTIDGQVYTHGVISGGVVTTPSMYRVGTFTADATTQVLPLGTLSYNFGPAAISLRAVPEPSTAILVGTSLMGLLTCAWRRRK